VSELKFLFRFVLDLDEDGISEELTEYGECTLVLRQENQRLIATSERTGRLLGKGWIEKIKTLYTGEV
jgi:hypothetical protein